MDSLLNKVRMRVVQATEKRIFHHFKHRQEIAACVILLLDCIKQKLKRLQIAFRNILKSLQHLYQVVILSKVV